MMSKGALTDFWFYAVDNGPSAMNWALLDRIEPELTPDGRKFLRTILASMADDKKWIDQARASIRDEGERIEHIGIMMKKAGLRSYTDKEGRIFVSESRDDAGR